MGIFETLKETQLDKALINELLTKYKTLFLPTAALDATEMVAKLDPQTMAFREGQRTVITYLLTQIGYNLRS